MAQFQLQDADGNVVGQESFTDFDEASAWATGHESAGQGWTMLQQIGGEWVPAHRDVSGGA